MSSKKHLTEGSRQAADQAATQARVRRLDINDRDTAAAVAVRVRRDPGHLPFFLRQTLTLWYPAKRRTPPVGR
jgi:hypothetical protein